MNSFNVKVRCIAAALAAAMFLPVWAQNATPVPQPMQQNEIAKVDSIIAVVNSDVITRNELRDRLLMIENRLKSQGVALPPRAQLSRQLLERMIVERAQIQLAKESGIRVEDTVLDRTIARMAEQNKQSMPEFRKKLEQDGIPYSRFREEIRDELIMQRLREKEVINKIEVSDSEVDNFLAAEAGVQGQEEIRLAHILVRIPENASPEQISARRARAEEVLRLVRSGGDFQQNAAIYSDADDALKGGEIGWRSRDRLPDLFSNAIKNLKPGETTDIMKSANGFHILKVLDRRTSGPAVLGSVAVQQTHARHILIKVDQLVSADEARRKLLELKQRLDHGAARFEDLARLYSNDLSAKKGGDLGWIYPGDTVPEFERAMNALKPGEISEPVESPFGYHLIQVVERKADDMSQERQRKVARQAIRERKIEEASEEWLRQVRDRAYVEYRLEER